MMEVRLILPRRPCCMPRSNLRIATLGDGCPGHTVSVASYQPARRRRLTISTSTGTFRSVIQGMAMLVVVSAEPSNGHVGPGPGSLQDGHENSKPQLLCAEERVSVRPPLSALDVIDVAENGKAPRGLGCVSLCIGVHDILARRTARPSHPMKRWCLSKVLW